VNNTEFLQALEKYNKSLTYYVVEPTERALQEDGRSLGPGYAAINTLTGVAEHTTVMLPGIFFQASHLDSMLASLLSDTPAIGSELTDMPLEDVVPN
jgi:hypothetical protein